MVVYIAHQHRVDFDLLEPGRKCRVDAVHDLLKFILAGNGVELTGVRAIDADVDRRQPRIAPVRHVARHAVTVGGHRNLADTFVFTHGGNDVGKSRRREGSPPVRRTFSVPSSEKARVTRRTSSTERKPLLVTLPGL